MLVSVSLFARKYKGIVRLHAPITSSKVPVHHFITHYGQSLLGEWVQDSTTV